MYVFKDIIFSKLSETDYLFFKFLETGYFCYNFSETDYPFFWGEGKW